MRIFEQHDSHEQYSKLTGGGCFCRQERGTYCGSTKRSGALSGDCSEHDMYFCRGPDSLSKWQGPCPNGCYAGTGGGDYCK